MTRNIPLSFDPSNLDMIELKELDLDNAALNWRTVKVREASIRPNFCSASTQVSAGSQQLINRGS